MNSALNERSGIVLVDALSRVWSRVRTLHHEVPPVVVLPAPAGREVTKLGHFSPLRWRPRRRQRATAHEVVVVAECLHRPLREILATLLHEAGHAANWEAGIFDCSSTSQYHNKKFKAAAERLGLTVKQVPNYGYAYTTLPAKTAADYEQEMLVLRQALASRDADPVDREANTRSLKAVCHCPYIIRVSRKTIEATTIRCDTCGKPFRLA